MLISKTPLRISFAGGGTDLRAFYEREYGAVVSVTINLYVYLAVHRFFEGQIQLKYSKSELVDTVDQIQHPLIRECMRQSGVNDSIEITSFADIPSKGSGLGSSSAFAVGLVKALHAFQGRMATAETCAAAACNIEIERLGEPIGKQDQYAAAYGGFNYIRFNSDETVHVEPILVTRDGRTFLEDHLLMFYTGITRNASTILSEQKHNTSMNNDTWNQLKLMRDQADALCELMMAGRLEEIGIFLHEGWQLKKRLTKKISSAEIDAAYDAARAAGAAGGKLLGAGGGGFLLFFVPPAKHQSVIDALKPLRLIRPAIDTQGSRLILAAD
jgi:D-glycero-alpha-D-manno-heptose-7-phosphate kinase